MTDHNEKTPANLMVDTNVDRARLRRERIAVRQALTASQRCAYDACINNLLWSWFAGQPVASVGFCWPMRGEADCRPVVLRLLAAGWRVAMPVVVELDAPMRFRAWTPDAPMTQDRYGIAVPATDEVAVPAALLVPLVAFDAAGYRLGYGGGYFDRTLAACVQRPFSIGVGYACSEVACIYPASHDIALDAVVTESGFRQLSP